METIEISGDVDAFLEAQAELVKNIDDILAQTMPDLGN